MPNSRSPNTPGLTLMMGSSPRSFLIIVARRELMVMSGALPTWLRRFFAIAISVIFL
ncbi:MAG: hypothetical protein M5U28_41220 [Sandaracinaceae bacterium]|nr:hypothetical protein [Sandaracinaceae bacterium]